MYTYMYIHVYVYMYMHVYVYVHVYVCICVYTYIHISMVSFTRNSMAFCCPMSLIVHQAFDHGAEVGTDDMDVEVEKKNNPELQGGFSSAICRFLPKTSKNYGESKMMPCETGNSSIKKRCHSWLFLHPAASHAPCFGIELLPWPQTYLCGRASIRRFHTFTLGRPPK